MRHACARARTHTHTHTHKHIRTGHDVISQLSDPDLGVYKYLEQEQRIVKIPYDAMRSFNALKRWGSTGLNCTEP